MQYLLFTLIILSCLYIFTTLFIKKGEISIKFLSESHTQILKGIAIILVILAHMGHKFGIRYLAPFGGTGVALFLIISGYGLSESYIKNGLINYWNKKLLKVSIPYIIIETFVLIIDKKWSGVSYILDITFLKPLHPFGWYMQFLLIWYILFFIIHKIKFLEKIKIHILIILSFALLFIPYELWAEQAFSFSSGILLSNFKNKIKIIKLYQIVLIFILGTIFLIFKQTEYIRNLSIQYIYIIQFFTKYLYAIGIIYMIYNFRSFFNNKLLYFLGSFSYEIYLVHGYTYPILNNISYNKILLFLFNTILASIILNNICKKLISNKKRIINSFILKG